MGLKTSNRRIDMMQLRAEKDANRANNQDKLSKYLGFCRLRFGLVAILHIIRYRFAAGGADRSGFSSVVRIRSLINFPDLLLLEFSYD